MSLFKTDPDHSMPLKEITTPYYICDCEEHAKELHHCENCGKYGCKKCMKDGAFGMRHKRKCYGND
jgi:hypothetical protein